MYLHVRLVWILLYFWWSVLFHLYLSQLCKLCNSPSLLLFFPSSVWLLGALARNGHFGVSVLLLVPPEAAEPSIGSSAHGCEMRDRPILERSGYEPPIPTHWMPVTTCFCSYFLSHNVYIQMISDVFSLV